MTDHLLVSKENGVATLTMNRPEVRNALSIEMRHAMFEAVDDIEHDASVRCVVLKGAGGHFMAVMVWIGRIGLIGRIWIGSIGWYRNDPNS